MGFNGGNAAVEAMKIRQSGKVTVTPVANTPTTYTVTFAVEFDATPTIQVTARTGNPGTQVLGASYNNESTTGFDIVLTRTNTTNTDVSWSATAPTQ